MKLTQKAISHLQSGEQRATRLKLALALNFSERWIEKLLEQNKSNGPLTTVTAVDMIKESGIDSGDVLENEEETTAA
jgi:hypothetical protein